MRAMFGLVLVLGVALAGFAVFMTRGYISQTETALAQERAFRAQIGPMVEVFVINKPLKFGAPITKDDVRTIFWPKAALPEAAFTDAKVLFPPDTNDPRYVLRDMVAFEPLLADRVTEPGQPAGLTNALERGERAFAITVNAATGVSGFVHPGDRVDVYWTGSTTNRDAQSTQIIESSVRVIAVDQTADANRVEGALVARTVTVAATAERVARLAQAQATGKLSLSLVGSSDESVSAAVEVDTRSLLGRAAPSEPARVAQTDAPRTCTVKTRKGAEVVDIEIPCTN